MSDSPSSDPYDERFADLFREPQADTDIPRNSPVDKPVDEGSEWQLSLLRYLRPEGPPERCDYCGQPYTAHRWPVPEEAQSWACNECDARWAEEAKE